MKRFMKHHKWILSLLLVALIGVGATGAYLVASSGTVKNTFASGNVTTEIEENVGSDGQKEVAIRNTGDLPVYVRARIVVGGVDQSKLVFTKTAPTTADLNNVNNDKIYIVMNDTTSWEKDGSGANDWYYYKQYLPAGSTTEKLMTSVYIAAGANVDTSHFTVTITQESAVASDTSYNTIDQIKTAFARN